ncbi:MAG: pyridoxamine 5'-phosphate oxidase family protein [Acidobacteria bacterium]|jgi:PPOX class probable F420-dependent enzyme|nr:pyridoxamine 5'-phosphate oxidase family protein [Acidobacteriota bacterium]
MFRSGLRSGAVLLVVMGWFATLTAAAGDGNAEPGDRERLLAAAREVIAASRFCALVTIGADGAPNVRMMDPFAPDEDMVVWMGTNALSRKVEDLRRNPHVAVYCADPDAPGYVTLRGVARLVDDPDETRKRWKDEWSALYRDDRSNYLLIEITPETVEVVNLAAGVGSEKDSWEVPAVVFGQGETSPAK